LPAEYVAAFQARVIQLQAPDINPEFIAWYAEADVFSVHYHKDAVEYARVLPPPSRTIVTTNQHGGSPPQHVPFQLLLVQVQSVLARMNQNGGCISTGAQPHYNTGGRQALYQE